MQCPILNFLYQIASEEYPSPERSASNTRLLHTIEKTLRALDGLPPPLPSIHLGLADPAFIRLLDRMLEVERDPVHTWKERQDLIKALKSERRILIYTKRRVHGTHGLMVSFSLSLYDLRGNWDRFRLRPWSNLLGWMDALILDPVRWFFKIVRGNMGYSIALAIYSPFTFFFITQPMNPHAMWAVGRVRTAYLDALEHLGKATGNTHSTHTAQSEPQTKESLPRSIPSPTGFPLMGDLPEHANQSWEERMSQFKAMQIAYEENLEIAPRMGRLEHMESQLNWPITAESAWIETERYLQLTSFLLANSSDYDSDFIAWVKNEEQRAVHVELYLWDRLTRFILDHPYTLMDESNEQHGQTVYVGRAFSLLRNMTQNLGNRFPGLRPHGDYSRIFRLSERFEQDRKDGKGVLDRLQRNLPLFQADRLPDPIEIRRKMKRQWETLYLLENRAQEAALSGLQLYVWSIRNAIHILQSLYSTRRFDLSHLALVLKRGATPSKLTKNPDFESTESQYEALLHLMILEFSSVKKELGEALQKDIEAVQRTRIIEEWKTSLQEREKLLLKKDLI